MTNSSIATCTVPYICMISLNPGDKPEAKTSITQFLQMGKLRLREMKSPKLRLLINGGAKIWTQVSLSPECKHALPLAATGKTPLSPHPPVGIAFYPFPILLLL